MDIENFKSELYINIAHMTSGELKQLSYLMEKWERASAQLGNNAQIEAQDNLHDFVEGIVNRFCKRGWVK
tara:strand:- start:38304 stop:38513 length:210 start_codon:yes stop_codon:yes gene_type:complete